MSHLLQQSLHLLPAPDGNSVVVLKRKPEQAEAATAGAGGSAATATAAAASAAAAASRGLPAGGMAGLAPEGGPGVSSGATAAGAAAAAAAAAAYARAQAVPGLAQHAAAAAGAPPQPQQAPPQQVSTALLSQCVQALRQNEEFRSVALQQLQVWPDTHSTQRASSFFVSTNMRINLARWYVEAHQIPTLFRAVCLRARFCTVGNPWRWVQALLPPVDMLRFLAVRFEIEDACKHLVHHVEPQVQAPSFLGSGPASAATSGAAAVNLTQAQPGASWPQPPTG